MTEPTFPVATQPQRSQSVWQQLVCIDLVLIVLYVTSGPLMCFEDILMQCRKFYPGSCLSCRAQMSLIICCPCRRVLPAVRLPRAGGAVHAARQPARHPGRHGQAVALQARPVSLRMCWQHGAAFYFLDVDASMAVRGRSGVR